MEITRHPALHEAFKIVLATKNERLEEISFTFTDEKTILTHWVPLLENGGVQGVVAVFHDISDLKRLETVRKDFVANVSHELRTPVTVIKGYAETLLSNPNRTSPEQVTRFIEKIYSHSERLAHLIGDLLTLSELESGKPAPALTPVSIEGAVRQVAALLEQKTRDKGIHMDLESLHEAPPVLAEHGRLEQVLINLLDNALEYTPANGSVTVSTAEEDNLVRVTVTDTGTGIPAKDLPRLFERFYRVDPARSRDQGGTGLGLAIAKHIVQLLGGDITVTSTPGKGSAFSFTLKKA
jgi:two-component system phosphate regulon sensor histidine kinase PhoR